MYDPPFDPWRVAEYLGVPVSKERIPGVEGYVSYHGTLPKIVLNCDAESTRQRFTLAHEIGHIILHKAHADKILFADDSRQTGLTRFRSGAPAVGTGADAIEERLCNRFAEELLMPTQAFQRFWHLRKMSARNVVKCANVFNVSIAATCIRTTKFDESVSLSLWHLSPWLTQAWSKGAHVPGRTVKRLAMAIGKQMRRHHKTDLEFELAGYSCDSTTLGVRRSSVLVATRRDSGAVEQLQLPSIQDRMVSERQ